MFNAQEIDVRLRRKLTLLEFGAIVFVFLIAVYFVFQKQEVFTITIIIWPEHKAT